MAFSDVGLAVTITTGALTCNASSFIGDDAGSTGVLNVNDDDADLFIAGATTGSPGEVANKMIYEKRLGARSQVEVIVPFSSFQQT